MKIMRIDEAVKNYCLGKDTYQFINGIGYIKLVPSHMYSSSDSAESIFRRQISENQFKYGDEAYDDFADSDCYIEYLALCKAERIGVFEYTVDTKKQLMNWISYYGSEGFFSVKYNLITGEEARKHQKTTIKPYNYYCG